MRRAAKIDFTQTEIVRVLRERGCKVLSLAAVGKGVPDLIVLNPKGPIVPGMCFMEVKNLAGRGKDLTPDQFRFHQDWPVVVVTSPEEALRAVGL